MAIELNRPILGIASVGVIQASWDSLGSTASTIVVTLQNYGTLYAKGVLVEWTAYMQALNETRNTARQGPIDIAQGASCPITLSVWVKPEDRTRMLGGSEHYKIQIRAEYSAPNDRRRWKYTAVRTLNLPSTFTMDDQVPDCTEKIL